MEFCTPVGNATVWLTKQAPKKIRVLLNCMTSLMSTWGFLGKHQSQMDLSIRTPSSRTLPQNPAHNHHQTRPTSFASTREEHGRVYWTWRLVNDSPSPSFLRTHLKPCGPNPGSSRLFHVRILQERNWQEKVTLWLGKFPDSEVWQWGSWLPGDLAQQAIVWNKGPGTLGWGF